ncbi:MAG: hypothetical protein ABIQ88_16455 [Chitinophagaceae bacterium]
MKAAQEEEYDKSVKALKERFKKTNLSKEKWNDMLAFADAAYANSLSIFY